MFYNGLGHICLQLVDVSGTFSSHERVTCGVPQGSILGPLLFLIYVNDMQAVVKNKLLLYADDSAILVAGKNRSSIEKELRDELHSVFQWLIDNKLSLHLGKTETILFGSKHRLKQVHLFMSVVKGLIYSQLLMSNI
jgi:hypothetical protein